MSEDTNMDINMKNQIYDIKRRIEEAKVRAGRTDDIMLIAVSKTQPYERLLQAQRYGLNVFGENKVQELVDKYPYVNDARWHLIGHLQKNKVKYILDKVELIHSVDNLGLAEEINKRASAAGKIMKVLIQINIGREASKSGIYEEEAEAFAEKLSSLGNIEVQGIMTVPPINNNEEETRLNFRRMKEIFDSLKKCNYKNFNIEYLSMGMTDDFEIAIEEGANIVRIGTGIFGKRVYKEEQI